VVLEKTLESPLDCKEIQPDNSEGNKSWIFIGRLITEPGTSNALKDILRKRNSVYFIDLYGY